MNKRKPVAALGPRKAPKQDRSRQTFQVILNGAIAVIRRDGFKKLSTNKVAEESGVSIGSLYQYFPSKAAIIAALIDQALENDIRSVADRLAECTPAAGASAAAQAFFSLYYRLTPEQLELRRIRVQAIPLVERSEMATRFHGQIADYVIRYFVENFQLEARDRQSEAFILQYLLKGIALSSVDSQIEGLSGDDLVGELSEILLNLLQVPQEKRQPR